MSPFEQTIAAWPYLPLLTRLGLALILGILVGLERERRRKEAGVRTFAGAALLGCLGSLLGQPYALASLGLLAVLVVLLNLQRIHEKEMVELTTSVALLIVGYIGILCGLGHTFSPIAASIITAALLAWKQPLTGFSVGLTEQELRSAILLAILAFIIFPIMPERAIDPWGLIEPRTAWATVLLISAIGFVNYVLWKLYGESGIEIAGFLAGLVNSTAAATELAVQSERTGPTFNDVAYRGVLLATAAMLLRNLVLLALLALSALRYAAGPLVAMLLACAALIVYQRYHRDPDPEQVLEIEMASPFSLTTALKYGFVFLVVNVAGILAHRYLGALGFYGISIIGGFVSSASAVASAATLAMHGQMDGRVAAYGALIACAASVLSNLPMVARIGRQRQLTSRLSRAVAVILVAGALALTAEQLL